MEALSGFTGLDYAVSAAAPSASGTVRRRRPRRRGKDPVGMIQLDNGIQVMIRRSRLPPDVAEYIDYRKNKAIANLREMMKEEGFQPTTQPGQPAPTSRAAGVRAATAGRPVPPTRRHPRRRQTGLNLTFFGQNRHEPGRHALR